MKALLEEGRADIENGRCYSVEEVRTRLRENTVYLTGDTHGNFERIFRFCSEHETFPENALIILGDAGINYSGGERDTALKRHLAKLPITLFCIHGNHEQRPTPELGYELSEYHGGKVWVEPEFPNLLFAVDGEVYEFCRHACLVLGGAYSVDKELRLLRGLGWWPDEQPSQAVKEQVERMLTDRGWEVDVVLSHTCPLRYEPTEVFLPGLDQSTVDSTTEAWLDIIEQRLSYRRWYCGHFHTEKKIDKLRFLFNDYERLPGLLTPEDEGALRARMERQTEILTALGDIPFEGI